MSIEGHIHFFDLKSKLTSSWSPHCSKLRMVLNYKQIPYTESFISYPDIQAVCRHFGIPDDAESKRATLPAIVHYGANGKVIKAIGNSEDIAKYLDELVPGKIVIPRAPGYTTAYEAFNKVFYVASIDAGIGKGAQTIAVPTIPAILDERACDFFIRTRTEGDDEHRSPLNWGSADPEDDWRTLARGIEPIITVLKQSSPSGPFFWGETPTFVDFKFAGILVWFKSGSEVNFERILGMSSEGGELERFWRACVGWVEGKGEVKEWDVKEMRVVS